jgi:tetratricopeptide (TPR) repeat protein
MRHIKKALFAVLLACLPLSAEVNPHGRLHDAFILERQGHFDEAIAAVKVVIDSDQLSGVELGRAWIMLGFACRFEGEFTEAQIAFERSLQILEHDPEHVSDYASALDNYAGLYSDRGQLQMAEPMWMKALRLREQGGDHAAVAATLTALAGLALAQSRAHDARQYLKRASGEMKLTNDLSDEDLVVFFETQAWLALTQRHPSAAVAGYQRALEICERAQGERHWLVGWEHMLLGKAYAQSGDVNRAAANMQDGIAILEQALGRKNPKYFVAQIAYSQVLDRKGLHAAAAQLREAAEEGSKDYYSGQCAGCTINVAAFR